MPIIEISKKDLCSLVGKKLSDAELREAMSFAKASVESAEGDTIKVEVGDVNRPDLWSTEGIARDIKTRLKKKVPPYKVNKSSYKVKVETKVKKVRPLIVCAVVKGLRLGDEAIKQIIQLQEKLCESFGRKREEAALGIYDFDKLRWPIQYTTTKPDAIKFVPLDMAEALTPKQILQRHEKGRLYGHLIAKFKEYPLLIDAAQNVLSMPPIINSEYSGKVTEKTKNVFIEVTGLSFRFIVPVLNIMTTALATRGGKIYAVGIADKKKIITPDLKAKEIKVSKEEINKMLGLELSNKQIIDLLVKSGFDAKLEGKSIIARYPAYRQDILDTRDIIEDIAISYGYHKLKPELPVVPSLGKASEESIIKEKITNILCGLGAQEIATFTLTNKEKLFRLMEQKATEVVEIANPVSATYSCLRSWLLPSLMEFLSKNKDVEYPQKIFEVGNCTLVEKNKAKNTIKLSFAFADNKVSFTQVKQILDYFLSSIGVQYKIKKAEHASFIKGRVGNILVKGKEVGIIGETHPAVLENWKLTMPIAAFELDLTKIC